MEGAAEFAGNLLAELMDLREDIRMRSLTEAEAKQRLAAIRRKREMGQMELARPFVEPGVLQLQR